MRFSHATAFNTAYILDWLQFKHRANGTDAWEGTPLITHLFGQVDLGILPNGENPAAINDMKSLIVRVEIPGWTTVMQGDAVNNQTNILITNHIELEADILQASLQGGGVNLGAAQPVDRANSEAWARHINPRFAIISAGSHGHHRHPRADAINRFNFEGNRLDIVQQHTIHYYQDANPLAYIEVPPIESQYGGLLGRTRKAVYTTFSSGNITFESGHHTPALVVAPANLPPYLP